MLFRSSNTLISLVVYVGLLIIGLYSIIKRQPIGFFVISYLLSIVLLSNALVNVGPPMADRFLFAPSLFFIGFLLILIHAISDKINTTAFSYGSKIMLIAFIIFSYIKVYSRNQDWKNNETLYRADIIKSPNSVRMLYYHGGMLLTQSDAIQDSIQKNNLLRMAVNDFNKAHQIYPDYASMYQNYGLAFYRLNNIDSAEWAWNRLKELRPDSKYIANNEFLIATYRFNSWNKKYEAALPRQNFTELLYLYRNAISYYDAMPGSWVLLGKLYTVNNKKDSATWAWNECLKRDSTNQEAKQLLINPIWK